MWLSYLGWGPEAGSCELGSQLSSLIKGGELLD